MVESPLADAGVSGRGYGLYQRALPQMVGIGPFISHRDTPFCKMQSGTLELTLFMVGLLRLMLPEAFDSGHDRPGNHPSQRT